MSNKKHEFPAKKGVVSNDCHDCTPNFWLKIGVQCTRHYFNDKNEQRKMNVILEKAHTFRCGPSKSEDYWKTPMPFGMGV